MTHFITTVVMIMLLAWPAAADMFPNAANAKQPDAINNLLGNTIAHTYFAKAYGNCTWATNGTGDNSACINLAIASAKLDIIIGGDFFRNGGAEVVLPAQNIGIGQTISQTAGTGITLRGAGGPGPFGYCKTSLTWTGVAGGTMISNELTIGGGLEDSCIKGNTTTADTGAGIGIQLRSATNGAYRNVYVYNVQSKAWDLDVDAANTRGLSDNDFFNVPVRLDSAGAINATCWDIGPGSATNDTWGNKWLRARCQHQNGVGWKIGNADTNFFEHIWAQPILAGTGKGVQLLGSAGGPFNLSEARENVISGVFLSGFYAETATFPSFDNYVTILGRGSGAPLPVIASGATLGYETDDGVRFDNRSGATTLTHGGMSYKATPGVNGAVFDIDTANGSNFATGAKFGPSLPIYLLYNNPTVGFNLFWKGGGNFAYGKGSSASYGGSLNYAATTGTFAFSGTTAAGNANDTAEPINFATLDRSGNFTLLPGGALLKAPAGQITGNMTVGSTAAPGINNAIFDVDAVTSFATAAKFGPSLPMYLMANSPVLGFNAYWNTGAWKYGKGSSASYGGTLGYAATTGALTFASATATGNADETITPTNLWGIDRFGHEKVSGLVAPTLSSCGTSPVISGDDRAGEVTMGTGSPTGCIITFTNSYAAAPYCTITWQATPLASQSYAVSASAILLTQTGTDSNKINYNCVARAGG